MFCPLSNLLKLTINAELIDIQGVALANVHAFSVGSQSDLEV